VNKFFTHGMMLDLLIVAHTKFMIMLTELKQMLTQEQKCLYSKTTTVLLELTIPKTIDVRHIFIALDTTKHTV
jgi:hypothetical protein